MAPNYKVFNSLDDSLFAKITDGTEVLAIEDKAAVTIDFAHAEIHEGDAFLVSKLFQSVADNGYADLRIITGSTKETHILMDVAADGKSYLSLYRGTTYSENGTQLTVYNLNEFSTNTSASAVYYAPTINNSGTLLYQDLLPGGRGVRVVGGEASTRAERILKTSTDYLLRVQNKSGNTADIAIEFMFYELE